VGLWKPSIHSKIAEPSSSLVAQVRRSSSSCCIVDQNDSMSPLSTELATRPIEPGSPASRSRCPNVQDVNWVDSTGRRDTSGVGVGMGRPAGWMKELTGRSAMRSPGAPSLRRGVEREFWRQVAKGLTSEDAAVAVGASQAAGSRWFRERGGMASLDLAPLSGRYLSFGEREEIALLRAQNVGVSQIAGRLGRHRSTISRELRRNAATRGGRLDYRASVAQWKAELLAQRPKPAKLVTDPRLHAYVQQRLAGQVRRPDGTAVAGPVTQRWKGRNKPRRRDRRWVSAWSPEQISHRLRVDFPDDGSMRISHEATLLCMSSGSCRCR